MSTIKPKIFIGSESNYKSMVENIKQGLEEEISCSCHPWFESGVFPPGKNTYQSIIDYLKQVDFSIIILSPDDKIIRGNNELIVPRDNLIFETGVSFGIINPERTILLKERIEGDRRVTLPTDLNGFNFIYFTNNLNIKEYIKRIKSVIDREGIRLVSQKEVKKEVVCFYGRHIIKSATETISLFGRDLSWVHDYSKDLEERLKNGIKIEVFLQRPQTEATEKHLHILEELGVDVYLSNKDHGLRCTIIDQQNNDIGLLMIAFKTKRNGTGCLYDCEIQNIKTSPAIWKSYKKMYDLTKKKSSKKTFIKNRKY